MGLLGFSGNDFDVFKDVSRKTVGATFENELEGMKQGAIAGTLSGGGPIATAIGAFAGAAKGHAQTLEERKDKHAKKDALVLTQADELLIKQEARDARRIASRRRGLNNASSGSLLGGL